MKLAFIGSGVELRDIQLDGLEIAGVARLMVERFDTLVVGKAKAGVAEVFASAFTSLGGSIARIDPELDRVDAVLCYPGGLGTWAELFHMLSAPKVDSKPSPPPIYLYNWEKYYSPLLLQIETAAALGLIQPEQFGSLMSFESIEELSGLLSAAT